MDKQAISENIMLFLKSEFPDQDVELTESIDLLEDWFIDSLWLIELVMYLEKEFKIKISRADVNDKNLKNVGTLTELVLSRLP